MKKLAALFLYPSLCIAVMSCMHDNGHTEISISEDDHTYSMYARFNKNKMRNVEQYMDSRIGRQSNMSFVNTRIDATLALDDHTKFYLKKSPGNIEIKFNKDENSDEAYQGIKSMCAGIKKLLAK